ncbi:MAG: 4-phosphoerythronate dehydrogenase PdxB [Thiotrichales bacterium]
MLNIVADENIPYVREAFGGLGKVTTRPGRRLCRADLAQADVLLVRSVTRVDAALLHGTPVRFVASATIGFDHIDRDYLAERAIPWATAPGCNAVPAAEWVVAALLHAARHTGRALEGMTVGIVGCGNVGSRVRDRLQALGMNCLINDPPRAAREPDAEHFIDLATALACDVVTLHVPLTCDGPYPTHHLLDRARLAELRPGTILLNAARGAVVDNVALRENLSRQGCIALLDCWEGEPVIDLELMRLCALATPHIAGYSLDGRVRGTAMIHRALCDWLGVQPDWTATQVLPELADATIDLTNPRAPGMNAIDFAVRRVYDIGRDDRALRAIASLPESARGPEFDRQRKEYPVRREFGAYRVRLDPNDSALRARLLRLGFQPET